MMSYIRNHYGFSLIEIIVVIVIMGILAAIGIPSLQKMVRDHKIIQYGTNLEYYVKLAKLKSMEKTVNTGVCLDSSTQFTIYNLTATRPSYASDSCPTSGGTSIAYFTIPSDEATGHNLTLYGSTCASAGSYPMGCIAFDPKGLAIWTGNVCVSNGDKYYKVIVDRASIRSQDGTGGCN